MSFWGFRDYVPVAKRRANALKEVEKLRKKGRPISPVVIEGRKIAKSFWGKAWCDNLERYSDFENRLPRGRTYVNNGSVIDLQIGRGKVEALVSGSEIYQVKIDIAVTAQACWKSICADCAGSVASLVELLQGKLSSNVMERVCRAGDGLFPSPKEIKMSCSCPDWADMCKHVAATLYGVGARLDRDPDLLFSLRGVERGELISTGADLSITDAAANNERVLADEDVAALFGLEIETATAARPAENVRSRGGGSERSALAASTRITPTKSKTAASAKVKATSARGIADSAGKVTKKALTPSKNGGFGPEPKRSPAAPRKAGRPNSKVAVAATHQGAAAKSIGIVTEPPSRKVATKPVNKTRTTQEAVDLKPAARSSQTVKAQTKAANMRTPGAKGIGAKARGAGRD